MQENREQLEAIDHFKGPMLVVAGPGSGKTTVITRRILNLVARYNVPPANILVVTFTRAAAKEMKERYEKLAAGDGTRENGSTVFAAGENASTPRNAGFFADTVTFGTFHSIFYRMLCVSGGYGRSCILDESEKRALLKEIVCQREKRTEGLGEFLKRLLGEISAVKSRQDDLKSYRPECCTAEYFIWIFEEYRRRLEERGLLDFDDILIKCRDMLARDAKVLEFWQKRFRYILVDEFQDINMPQYEVLKLLAGKDQNVFAVGDEDQSIYGFRGSRPGLLFEFLKDFKGAVKVTLRINYRSSPEIVLAASRLIVNNEKRFSKELCSATDESGTVGLLPYENSLTEREEILKLVRERIAQGTPPSEIAILARTNLKCTGFAITLGKANVPFTTSEKLTDIYGHFSIRDVMAYIGLAIGPIRRSDFLICMNKPSRGIERRALTSETVSFESLRRFYAGRRSVLARLRDLERDLSFIGRASPRIAVRYIRKVVGYDRYLRKLANEQGFDAEEVFMILDEFEDSLLYMKTFAELFEEIRAAKAVGSRSQASGGVRIMTFHGAKGLEFRTVFVVNANEGSTPYRKAVTCDELEEERRMFYVAMTRAKRELFISFTRNLQDRRAFISRFAGETEVKTVGGTCP